MKFLLKTFVAAIVAVVVMCVLIMHDASDNVVITFYFATAIGVAAVLGAFDMPEKKQDARHERIEDAARGYKEAA